MDNNIYEKYKLAGKIAAKARDYGKELIKPGVSLLYVADKIETKIIDMGAKPAFPVNISINDIAAHYTPSNSDNLVFKKGDVVKLDVGAHVDGCIADTALTLEIGTSRYADMIKSTSEALDLAIDLIKPGIDLGYLGGEIKKIINSYGFKPIDNLTGHSMDIYNLHAGLSVPNVPTIQRDKPKVGDVIAIEPFATDGKGHVISGDGSNIYICNKTIRMKFVRRKDYRYAFEKYFKEYKTLPFAQRWVKNLFKEDEKFLNKLSYLGLIKHYPQLVEEWHGVVAQKEHTVIITEDGCEVTT